LLIFLAILMISSTIYDKLKPDSASRLFTSFSIPKNWNKLTKTNTTARPTDFLYGLKVFSTFCIVFDHRQALLMTETHYQHVENVFGKILFEILKFPMNHAVERFFVISGFLVTRSCIKAFQRFVLSITTVWIICNFLLSLSNRFNFFSHCWLRYVRLVPSLLFILALYSSSLPNRLISGPSTDVILKEQETCRNNWWWYVLMIQNYIDVIPTVSSTNYSIFRNDKMS
jgi:hypothetical protein